MVAQVFFGPQVVDVPDTTYTLEDICDALQIPQDARRNLVIRRKEDALVVATLPFETLPSSDDGDVYELWLPVAEGTTNPVAEEEEEEDAELEKQILQKHGGGGSGGALGALFALATSSADSSDPYVPVDIGATSYVLYPRSVYNPFVVSQQGFSACAAQRWAAPTSGPYLSSVVPYAIPSK